MTNCYRCGDDDHLSYDCPSHTYSSPAPRTAPASGAAQNDGRPRWCGTCNEHSRHIDLANGTVKRCQCHPNSHEQLRQHRKCPTCHATVVEWDINPCGRHILAGVQLPYVGPSARPSRLPAVPEPNPETEKLRLSG
jgi:hypothetical protein